MPCYFSSGEGLGEDRLVWYDKKKKTEKLQDYM